MIIQHIYDIAAEKGIELSHVSIHDASAFTTGNKKSLKILSGGKLVFVPYKPEELMDGIVREELKERILSVLSGMPKLS